MYRMDPTAAIRVAREWSMDARIASRRLGQRSAGCGLLVAFGPAIGGIGIEAEVCDVNDLGGCCEAALPGEPGAPYRRVPGCLPNTGAHIAAAEDEHHFGLAQIDVVFAESQ